MPDQREAGIIELRERIKAYVTALGLKALKRSPAAPIIATQIPGVFIHEGDDDIIKRVGRNWSGYPVKRQVKIHFEVYDWETGDVKELTKKIRNILFVAPLTSGGSIQEIGAFGPANNGVPGLLYKQLIISLAYDDLGPVIEPPPEA